MSTSPSVDDMMAAYAQDAVEYSQKTLNVTLDYSEESVKKVEDLLFQLHATIPQGLMGRLFKKGPPAEEIDRMSKMFGGYVGEVIKRGWGARWKLESEAFPGQQVITLEVSGGGDIWPHFKVGKRLTNGSEDNVWHYFQVLKKKYSK